jgi:hypothetical protein
VASGGEDETLVAFERFEPSRDIGGMILAHFGGDAEIGAEEGRTQLGDQLFVRLAA